MRLRNEAKVGLIVFTGIIMLIIIYWFLGGLGLSASKYNIYGLFPNAQKLDKRALVRMAGVKVGIVSGTSLTGSNRARVDMLIDNDIEIPKDSVARITSGGFIGDNYVEIVPGTSKKSLGKNERIPTISLAQPDELLQQASVILGRLDTSTKAINGLLSDEEIKQSLKQTVLSLRDTARSASKLAETTQQMMQNASPGIQQIVSNLSRATAGAERISLEIEDALRSDLRPSFKALTAQADIITKDLDSTILQAKDLLKSFNNTAGKLDTSLGNVGKEIETAAVNVKDASSALKDIATDPCVAQNLKATISNAAEVSEQLKQLTTSLNKRYGSGREKTPQQKAAVPNHGLTGDALWNTGNGEYRFDANYVFLGNKDKFYRIGAYNIGENTKLNLQEGKALGNGNAFRYGLYASRLGAGYDYRLGKNVLFSTDVFRPNDPEMELKTLWEISNSMDFYAGIDDVFHKDNRNVLLGVNVRK